MKLDEFRISGSQKDRIRAALEQNGYSEDDFEWVETENAFRSGERPTTGTEAMYVIYKPTGFRRMYDGTSWPTGFEEDVRSQIFKPGS